MTRHPLRSRRLAQLALAGLLAAACDQRGAELPTQARPSDGPSAQEAAPLISAGADAIPGRYVVAFKGEVSTTAATALRMVSAHGGKLHHTYTRSLSGFAATLSEAAVEEIRRNPSVRYVAQDAWARPHATQTGATWGLDRIDQRDLPLNGSYSYTPTGAGVRVYVIDSGIRTTHTEFGGRATVGTDFVGDGLNGQDCRGHGTHVAGTIAGATYGVAKGTQLVSVRVFGCTGGSPTSTIIAAVDWVTANAVKPAVTNMSLGGGFYQPLNDAVTASIASGIVYTLSAGNDNVDACQQSPASTPAALTVASITSGDVRSSFSNWGSCVDLFAPGSDITSAWYQSDTQTGIISGTSMAAPHVAGVAALYLQGAPAATPATVASAVVASVTHMRISAASIGAGSPNKLLFSGLTVEPPAPRIGLNPAALGFIFLRLPAGTSSAASVPPGGEAPRFTASGAGSPRSAALSGDGTRSEVATIGGSQSAQFLLTNPGTGMLDWTAASDRGWLTASPGDGAVASGATALVTATVTGSSLAPGSYTGALTFRDPAALNSPLALPVTVDVLPALALKPGSPRTGLSGAYGSLAYFVVTVPAGATSLLIATSGGTGDADLHVSYGVAPTRTRYDCRPFTGGNTESCQLNFPPAGTYYVLLHGFQAFSGVTLSAAVGGVPAAPSGVAGTAVSSTRVRVRWTDGSVNESSFTLARARLSAAGSWGAWETIASPAADSAGYTDTGAAAGTTYRYRLRACNGSGCSAWAASANVTTPGVATPDSARATVASATSVLVAWRDMSRNESSFQVERQQNNAGTWSAWAAVATRSANATSYTDAGRSANVPYRYRVRACDGAVCSGWATTAAVTVPTLPAAPTGLGGTVLSGTSYRVTWADASGNESSFQVERQQNVGGAWGAFANVATTASNATGFTNTGLAAGGTYRWRVRSCNAAGCSAWVTGTAVTLPTVPAAPATLTATAASATTVNLAWPDATPNETSFQVERQVNTGGTWGAWGSAVNRPANSTSYAAGGLSAATQYRFRVRACNLAGCSAWTQSAAVTTPA